MLGLFSGKGNGQQKLAAATTVSGGMFQSGMVLWKMFWSVLGDGIWNVLL